MEPSLAGAGWDMAPGYAFERTECLFAGFRQTQMGSLMRWPEGVDIGNCFMDECSCLRICIWGFEASAQTLGLLMKCSVCRHPKPWSGFRCTGPTNHNKCKAIQPGH